jgi:hypothetical protein
MDTRTFCPDKIVDRLKIFNYRYQLNGQTLKVFLPMFCYLKIDFKSDKVKMTSHLNFGFRFLPLEYNFLIYGFALYTLAWFNWTSLNKAIFLLIGLFIVHFVVCFIKIEALRTTIQNWFENDNRKKDL